MHALLSIVYCFYRQQNVKTEQPEVYIADKIFADRD